MPLSLRKTENHAYPKRRPENQAAQKPIGALPANYTVNKQMFCSSDILCGQINLVILTPNKIYYPIWYIMHSE